MNVLTLETVTHAYPRERPARAEEALPSPSPTLSSITPDRHQFSVLSSVLGPAAPHRLKPYSVTTLFWLQLVFKVSAPLCPVCPMGRAERSAWTPCAKASGSPAQPLASGHVFQHSAEVTTGCRALRVGKGPLPTQPPIR